MDEPEAPVVVVGAGPIGLAAAAELAERGLEPLVLEAGEVVGASVRQWGHVRLFSPWGWLLDPAAQRLLEAYGWVAPDPESHPTGAEWVAGYLEPLAEALGDRVRIGARVVGVARRGRDRLVDAERATEPLTVHLEDGAGSRRLSAAAVIDASGTWSRPSPLGGDGLPASGEHTAADRLRTGVPNLRDPAEYRRYAGRHVVIAGSGHSALTSVAGLADLVDREPGTRVSWLLRRSRSGQLFGGGDGDQLPARGALGVRARVAVEAGAVTPIFGFRVAAVEVSPVDGALTLIAEGGDRLGEVEEVLVLTGFRPDLSWLTEVRLELDPAVEAPVRLAPLIDPNVHSCGTVRAHGAAELAHPEPGLYLVGMKSYGRAPTFLARTGYEQVRSVAAQLAGDLEAAARTELILNETGVCGGAGIDEVDEREIIATDPGAVCGPEPAEAATASDAPTH